MADFIPAIDISAHQGEFFVRVAKEAGVNVFGVRALFGTTIDKNVSQNVARMKHNGVEFFLYGWFRPDINPTTQATLLYNMTKDYGATLVPMADVEDHGDLKPWRVRRNLRTYINLLHDKVRKHVGIYTGAPFWNKHVASDKFGANPLWVARYNHTLTQNSVTKIWTNGYKKHPVPADPKDWAAYALSHARPVLPMGWDDWTAWQFSAGYNGCGMRYGAQSADLDLNIIRKSEMFRLRLP